MAIPMPARINVNALHAGMAAANIDLLVASSLENFFYIADSWLLSQQIIPERLCFALLARDRDPGIVACYCEESQLRAESWITDLETYLEHRESPVEVLSRFIRERYGATIRIGIEKRTLASTYVEELASHLPAAVLLNADPVFDAARAIKTEPEVAIMTRLGLQTEQVILDTFSQTQPGQTDKDMADRLVAQLARQGAASIWFTLAAGAYTAINHPAPRDEQLTKGEILRVDIGGTFNGYQSDVARTAVVGPASSEQQTVYRNLRECERATIASLRPGGKATDVYIQAQQFMATRGLSLTSQSIGHSLGIGMHEHPILHAYNDTELAPGMVLSIEPAVKDSQGFLYHLEDLALVTEDEPVILTTLMNTEELFSLDAE